MTILRKGEIQMFKRNHLWLFPMIFILALFILGGCSESDKVSEQKKPGNLFLYSESTVEQKELSETKTSTEKLDTEENYPYAVSFDELIKIEDLGGAHPIVTEGATFDGSGVNSPAKFEFSVSSMVSTNTPAVYIYPAEMGGASEPVEYLIGLSNKPTKIIQVFTAGGTYDDRREVKVNTEIQLVRAKAFDEAQKGYTNLDGHVFYAFYNNHGTLSLATENFAGNMLTTEDTQVLMEYIKKE